MTNISSVWQVGDVTFKAVEFDEDTTLATTYAKFIGCLLYTSPSPRD